MDKDMILQPEQLGSLFNMSRDPVLGIDNEQIVVFANPVAAQLGMRAGMEARDLQLEQILADPGEQFIASFQMGVQRMNVSVRRIEQLAICVFSLLGSAPPFPGHAKALNQLTTDLMTTRMAIDALTCRLQSSADPAMQEAANTLYKQYYLLRRTCIHMRQATGILQNDLPFQPKALDLGTVCRELCDTVGRLTEPLGISVLFKADFSIYLTMADRELIESMLSNLLTNSLLHCKRGDTIQVELSRQGERFIIAVSDTGSGISAEKLASLFNGVYAEDLTDTSAGAGLGLFVARGVAERHGGAMILESRDGAGTSVRISLPYRKSESTVINSPVTRYRSDGMNMVLTELAPLLDKRYYTRRMFD